jgi:cytochrome b
VSAAHDAIEAGGAMPPAMVSATMPVTVKVWDGFVRIFHWSLVAAFLLADLTGDEIERIHVIAGYVIASLLAARLVWGFLGPEHARFRSFVCRPRVALAYLRDITLLRARRHLGHNPAGGAMILALLATLAATCITGIMMTTDAYWGTRWVEEVHETLANATVGLIALHVLGVLVASFAHRENLVRAMVTGYKFDRL